MLPAVYRWIGAAWGATPTHLGYITLARALVQALAAPVGGIAGHLLHRGRIIGAGCLLWAACTATFAGLHSLPAGVMVWAVNGLGLALSLTADLFPAAQRGRAFGALYLTGALGGMAGQLYATNLGAHRPLGVEGWRFAFLSLAVLSAAAGAANLLLTGDPLREAEEARCADQGGGLEPPLLLLGEAGGNWRLSSSDGDADAAAVAATEPAGPEDVAAGSEEEEAVPLHRSTAVAPFRDGSSSHGSGTLQPPPTSPRVPPPPAAVQSPDQRSVLEGDGSAPPPLRRQLAGVLAEVGAVVRIPTFLLIVAQGICGSIPWSALVFLTLYFQLIGMGDAQASLLVSLFLAGTALGGLLGGCVGDAAARRWPLHGRIAVTQFSVGVGIPFAFLVFKGLPRNGSAGATAAYAGVLLAFALLKAWPAPACNNPIFAEIVPARQRSLVYSFDRCFEGAIAACAAPLVGLLSERVFGFSGSGAVTHDRARDLANAAALGNAILAFLVMPWSLTLLLYTSLHWSYPADKAAALRAERVALKGRARALEEPEVLLDRLSVVSSQATVLELGLSRADTGLDALPGASSSQLPPAAADSLVELAGGAAAPAEEEQALLGRSAVGPGGGDGSSG